MRGPLMADFLDVANYLSRTNVVQDKKEHFNTVFGAIGRGRQSTQRHNWI